jgi:hypothetical protein
MAAKVVHPMMSFSPVEWMDGRTDGLTNDDDDDERVSSAPTRCFFSENRRFRLFVNLIPVGWLSFKQFCFF